MDARRDRQTQRVTERPTARDAVFRDRMRARLLEVAEAIIASDGFTAVQARRVAAAAPCAIGTIYNIYRDIDGLILAANTRTLADLAVALTAAHQAAAGLDLEARLMALAVAYLDFATGATRRWRAVFEHHLPADYPLAPSYTADRRRLLGLIESEIGETGPSDPAQRYDAARALFSATHGNVLLSLDAKLGPFDRAACERQLLFVVRHVVAGLEAAGRAGL